LIEVIRLMWTWPLGISHFFSFEPQGIIVFTHIAPQGIVCCCLLPLGIIVHELP